jgi:hypothetical protein
MRPVTAGTFWKAYSSNRDEAVEDVIDANPVAAALRGFMSKRTLWTGTASDLLSALAMVTAERIVRSNSWPEDPGALAGRLRRAGTFLRKIGIEISFDRKGHERTRTIHIANTQSPPTSENGGARSSAPSAASAAIQGHPSTANGFASEDGPADGASRERSAGMNADGADTNRPLQSNLEKYWCEGDGNL